MFRRRREDDEPRERRRKAQGPSTARERLVAAESRIEELTAELASLRDENREAVDRQLLEHRTTVEGEIEALRAQMKEDYRRQVGVLDVVRRQQKRQDETANDRLRILEATVADLPSGVEDRIAASEQRLVAYETRIGALEQVHPAIVERLKELTAAREELAASIDRVSNAVRAVRESAERTSTRTDAAEAAARQALADVAAAREQVGRQQHLVESLNESVANALRGADEVSQEIAALAGALGPLGPIPERVTALAEELATLTDRIIAAELVLNQRDDLELQLERAEEFERMLAEVDPATYATRDELAALRADLTTLRENVHGE